MIKEVEFPAGRMDYDQFSKKVTVDKRQGKIYVYHVNKIIKDSMNEKHFKWIDTQTNQEELDLIIFQNDADVKKVKDRVYYLSFQTFEDKYFFWMQGDKQKDEEIIQKIKEIIQMPDAEQKMEIEEVKKQPQQQNNDQQLNQFQNLFQTFQNRQTKVPELAKILNNEFLQHICQNKEFQDSLIPHLPQGQQNLEGLFQNINSPYFQQGIETLEKAVQSSEGLSILLSMGLDTNDSQFCRNGLDALYKALIKTYKK